MERGQSIPLPVNPQGLERRGASVPLRAYTANDDNNYFLKPEEALYMQNNGNMLFRLSKESTDEATVGSNLVYDSFDKTKQQITDELNAQVKGIQEGIMVPFAKEETAANNALVFEMQKNAEKIKSQLLTPAYLLSNLAKQGTMGIVDPTTMISDKDLEAIRMIHGVDNVAAVSGFAAGWIGLGKGMNKLRAVGLMPQRIRNFTDAAIDTLGSASLMSLGLSAQHLYGNLDDEQYAEMWGSATAWDIGAGVLMGTFARMNRYFSPRAHFSWLGRNIQRLSIGAGAGIGGAVGYATADDDSKLFPTVMGMGLGAGLAGFSSYQGGKLQGARIQNARNREIALRDAEHVMSRFDISTNDVKALAVQLELRGVVKDARTAEDEIKFYFKETFDQLTENILKKNPKQKIDKITKNQYLNEAINHINETGRMKEGVMGRLEKMYGKGIDPNRWSDRSIQIVSQFKQNFANKFTAAEKLPVTQNDKAIDNFERFVDAVMNQTPRTYTIRFAEANIKAIENSFYKTMKKAYEKAGFGEERFYRDFDTTYERPSLAWPTPPEPSGTIRNYPYAYRPHLKGTKKEGPGIQRPTGTRTDKELAKTKFSVQHLLNDLKEEARKHPFMHEGQLVDRLRVVAAETADKMSKGSKASRNVRNVIKKDFMEATEDLIDHVKKYTAARRKKLVDSRKPNIGDKDPMSLKDMFQIRRELGFMIDNKKDYNGRDLDSQTESAYRYGYKLVSEKIENLAAKFYGKGGKNAVGLIRNLNNDIQRYDLFTKVAQRSKFRVEQKTANIIDNAYTRYHMGRSVGGPIAGEIAMAIGRLEKPTHTFSGKDTIGFSVWERFKNSMSGVEPYISYQLPSAKNEKFVGGYDPLYFNDAPSFMQMGGALLNRRVETFDKVSKFFSTRTGTRLSAAGGSAASYLSADDQDYAGPKFQYRGEDE